MGPGTGVEGGERENRRICFEVLRHLRRREGGREGGEAGEKEEEKAERQERRRKRRRRRTTAYQNMMLMCL